MSAPSTRPANALEILIADDDELLCAHLEVLLAKHGLHALSVNSLELAREAMRAVYLPVLIVNRYLGDGDGADLCREYRAKQHDKRVRILMLSSSDSPEERRFALASGADEFISKRSGNAAIIDCIRRLHEMATTRAADGPAADAEAARLRALADYAILDSSSEAAFDDITLIASTLFATPIAAISLIDAHRQWFKSSVGFAMRETPREHAFCAHAIKDAHHVMVVNDARADARFASNPLVTEGPRIRFYAGAPIVTGDGIAIGSMCVIDTQPRDFTLEQQKALQALARQVVYLLDQCRINKDFEHALAAQRTAEAELRRREALLRDAYEQAPIGKALVSTSGQWLQVNRALCAILGYGAQELLRTTFQALTHPDDLEADLDYVKDMLAGRIRTYEMEKRYVHKDGHTVWALLTVSLVRDAGDQPVFFVAEVQDITSRKRLERAQEQRFAVLGRELEEPVDSLLGSLALLDARVGAVLPAAARSLFDLSLRSAQRLQGLIGDMLAVEKIEAGTFDDRRQRIEADELLARAMQEMRSHASQCDVRLSQVSASPGLQLSADRDRIVQVLSTLIANAVKSSPAGARVEIAATPLDANVRFSVTDHAAQIPAELHARMFAGGLSLCKAIVEAHHGTLSFHTGAQGSTFYVDLPRAV